MSRSAKFWRDFLKKPDTNSRQFPSQLWSGIPSENDLRRLVWLKALRRVPFPTPKVDHELSDSLKEEIEMELDPIHFAGLDEEDLMKVKKILTRHCLETNGVKYKPGSAQLVATLLLTVMPQESETYSVYRYLMHVLRDWERDNCLLLKEQVLVLAEIMWQELPELCQYLNEAHFDVLDLVDLVMTWALSIFASSFPALVTVRMVDVLMFQDPSVLIAFVFGIFKVYEQDILDQEEEKVFEFITDIPLGIQQSSIDNTFLHAYDTFGLHASKVAALSKRKDWLKAVSRPGTIVFGENVGEYEEEEVKEEEEKQEVKEEKKAPPASVATTAGGMQIVTEDYSKPKSAKEANEKRRLDQSLALLEKQRRLAPDGDLRQVLAEAQKVIRGQNDRIQELLADLTHNEDSSLNADFSSYDSRTSSVSTTIEEIAASLNELEKKERSQPASPRSREPMFAKKKPSSAEGFVKHAKLFHHQQFPCLYMEGYLLKARRHKSMFARKASGVYGQLHRRFFVLQGNFLTYFKSHRSSKPSKDISLDMRGREVVILDDTDFGRFGFQVSQLHVDKPFYTLFANTADERNVWLQVLRAACDAK